MGPAHALTNGPLTPAAMGLGTALLRRSGLLLRCALGAGSCLALALVAVPAAAQNSTAMTAKTEIVQPLSVVKQADLDFGKVAETGAGTVVLAPTETPTCTVTGGVAHYGICQPAVFEGYGQSGRTVRIKLPPSGTVTITNPGGATMQITNMVLDGSPELVSVGSGNGFRRYRIDSSDGLFDFRVGGTLNVAGGQAAGVYSATFSVEVAYE